jgi:hypothetical protein
MLNTCMTACACRRMHVRRLLLSHRPRRNAMLRCEGEGARVCGADWRGTHIEISDWREIQGKGYIDVRTDGRACWDPRSLTAEPVPVVPKGCLGSKHSVWWQLCTRRRACTWVAHGYGASRAWREALGVQRGHMQRLQ